jgi:RNA polymerase sigma-70 factor (ECF subfamily)
VKGVESSSNSPPEGEPALQQDRAATIDRLFRDHNRKLVGLLVTRLRNEQEAKEVAQEAYVKLLQLEDRMGAIGYLRSYLFRIAENLATDRIRQRKTREQLDRLESADDLFVDAHGERAAIAEQDLAMLQRAVSELPDVCRRVFTLHKLADRPVEEVAAIVGLKERMVRRYLRRALVYVCLRCEGHSIEESWRVIP